MKEIFFTLLRRDWALGCQGKAWETASDRGDLRVVVGLCEQCTAL
jgi:hypothetical protein